MNSKQKKTMELIYRNPIQADILWNDIEKLFTALGAKLSEGSGSRLRVKLNGVRAVFHRPHPQKTTDKGAINSVRKFLENAGVNYDGI
ncbi:MAG: type II toxin-antitoxin system HicA family toxin [Treponema sp.]|nr:type II toxin-antitoxin system HicA family toxin [Treponema sp.]